MRKHRTCVREKVRGEKLRRGRECEEREKVMREFKKGERSERREI